MQIRDGRYYKDGRGVIFGPITVEDGIAKLGGSINKRWHLDGRRVGMNDSKWNLVEELVVFPMPELSPRDNTVANDDDGYILEFVADYQTDEHDDGLHLFTRSRLLDMLKVRDGYNKRMVSLNLTLDTREAREELRKALENLHVDAGKLIPLVPGEPMRFLNINPTRIEDFASVLADSIANGLTVHAFENDLNAGLAINGHIDVITKNISARLITFLRAEGVNVYYDGGIVKGPAKTGMSEAPSLRSNETTAADAMAEVLLNSPVMKELVERTRRPSDVLKMPCPAQQKEFIVAAAIYHGGIISLPKPARHHTIMQAMLNEMFIEGMIAPQQQGFITSTGRYVNRTEAWHIARAAGQITRKTSSGDAPKLFSEDLW